MDSAHKILAVDQLLVGVAAAALLFAGILSYVVMTRASASTPTAAPHGPFVVNLTITTGAGPNGTWPAYIPSEVKVPADALVEIRIVNLDTSTTIPEPWNEVKGTVGGTMSVAPLDLGNPNHPGTAAVVRTVDPAKVAHTFSVTALGISVPIEPKSLTTFDIRTGHAGAYAFRCFDPCGYGSTGWNGAMATPGYMEGTFVVR